MQKMGERIKRRRDVLGLNLSDLARNLGVSVSLLSQIENGKAFPSIVTLKKIADGLNTTVGEIIGENDTLSDNPVVRAEERRLTKETDNGTAIFLLSNHSADKQMETYYVEMKKGGTLDGIMMPHNGQEFCFIEEGVIEVTVGALHHRLKKGDSLYFDSMVEHTAKNVHSTKSEMLWIVTPPGF